MSVTGHIPVHMLANEAVRAGYDGIEHVNMLFLNFFADARHRHARHHALLARRRQGGGLRPRSKPVKDFFALLREHHTVIDPTLDAFEDLLVGRAGKVMPGASGRGAAAGAAPSAVPGRRGLAVERQARTAIAHQLGREAARW